MDGLTKAFVRLQGRLAELKLEGKRREDERLKARLEHARAEKEETSRRKRRAHALLDQAAALEDRARNIIATGKDFSPP